MLLHCSWEVISWEVIFVTPDYAIKVNTIVLNKDKSTSWELLTVDDLSGSSKAQDNAWQCTDMAGA